MLGAVLHEAGPLQEVFPIEVPILGSTLEEDVASVGCQLRIHMERLV